MMIRRAIHRAIAWYLRRCAGAFHTFPYGDHGRYVVLMNEQEYHYYKENHDANEQAVFWNQMTKKVSKKNDRMLAALCAINEEATHWRGEMKCIRGMARAAIEAATEEVK